MVTSAGTGRYLTSRNISTLATPDQVNCLTRFEIRGHTHRIGRLCAAMSETGVDLVKARAHPVYLTFRCKSLFGNITSIYDRALYTLQKFLGTNAIAKAYAL